jgi:hypothetical protein
MTTTMNEITRTMELARVGSTARQRALTCADCLCPKAICSDEDAVGSWERCVPSTATLFYTNI